MDYLALQAKAVKMIKAKGRQITLFSLPKDEPINPQRPWKGVNASIDPSETSIKLLTYGVFVPPNTVRQFGITSLGDGTDYQDLITKTEEIAIIAGQEVDFKAFNTIRDRGKDYGILASQVLRPGDVTLLAFVGIRR